MRNCCPSRTNSRVGFGLHSYPAVGNNSFPSRIWIGSFETHVHLVEPRKEVSDDQVGWSGGCRGIRLVVEHRDHVLAGTSRATRARGHRPGAAGRTVNRSLQVQRGGGTYQRELQIQRPGGTLDRSVTIQRGGRPGYAPGGFGYRGAPIVARNIFVAPRPASSFSFGIMAAPMFALPFFGGGFAAAPPPVVVAPMVAGSVPQAGAVPPGIVQGPPGQASALDPVALTAQRLQSRHSSSRRDAAVELGRMGDPRAVPPLVYALKYDSSKDVKVAAAAALGQIGGSEAEVVLERCIIYEKKQDVRDAAALALRGLRDRQELAARSGSGTASAAPRTIRSHGDQTGQIESSVPRLSPAPPPPATGRRRFVPDRNPRNRRWTDRNPRTRLSNAFRRRRPRPSIRGKKGGKWQHHGAGVRLPKGIEHQPAQQLGIEVGALGGHRLEVRGDRLDVLHPGGGDEAGQVAAPRGDVGQDLARSGGRSGTTDCRSRSRPRRWSRTRTWRMLTPRARQSGLWSGASRSIASSERSRASIQAPSATVPKPRTSWSPPSSIASQAARQPSSPSPTRSDLELGREPLGERRRRSGRGSPRPAGASAGSGGRGRSCPTSIIMQKFAGSSGPVSSPGRGQRRRGTSGRSRSGGGRRR